MDAKQHYSGLTDTQVKESREKFGSNLLTPPQKTPLWKLFFEKFQDPIIRILLIAALLSLCISFIHNEYAETIGIFCAIFLATGVAFWFEMDANKKFDILNQVNDDVMIKVIRNGNLQEVPKKDIVVGDIVLLETGEEVPADGELLEAISLQIDESCLTGELMIDKTTNPEDFDSEATYPSNWVMRGTKVLDGHGIMEVKQVGDATQYGQVAEKATEISGEETPLNRQLNGLAKFIGVAGFALAILTFGTLFIKDLITHPITWGQFGLLGAVMAGGAIALSKVWVPILYDAFSLAGKEKPLPRCINRFGWVTWLIFGIIIFVIFCGIGVSFGVNPLNSSSWIDIEEANRILQYFMIAVTLIVVAVPEGLPMSVTLSLALSMRRMLQTNNLVRKMHACETMGATTVICTDKTGTLTQNQMRVFQSNFFPLKNQELTDNTASNLIKEGIAANSTAFLDYSDPQKISTMGNPTEAALLLWLHNKGIEYAPLRENAHVDKQLTFSTERKYMATLVNSPLVGKKVLYMKGAPEIVLSKCKTVETPEGEKPVSEYKGQIEEQLLAYQNQAMRTLGFAYKIINEDNDQPIPELTDTGLIFLGFVAISDPVREDVPAAVAECLNAGIQVKIVTGDTTATAREIARQIGIWKPEDTDENIITGTDFEALPDDEAFERVKKLKVMCRARPTDKQRLVELLQKDGQIVAVTGDGTNDAPALNYANVGLSMGTGTSVAKEASDITLLDDSFKSIATAVMWGRSLYQNIQRFLLFQLTINVVALVIVFLGSIFGHELPLTVTQMLWVNLIMDTFAAGALASLPPNKEVMKDKPRKNEAFIVTPPMRNQILWIGLAFVAFLMGLLYYFTNAEGEINRHDLACFFTIFVMLQFWNLFNAKAFATGKSAFNGLLHDTGFITVALLIIIGQFFIVTFGGDVFRTVPLSWQDWLLIIGSTSLVLWIGEIFRLFGKKKK
ncbi:calcium-translocating P-type ATPase, PMCA-type [Coprobacter fastidiosus]|uniref:calcium-translocating P-type ATPase, PMCA-type n=1 Tax=Coprobacter fastidiosus TaxID=1099853 RepID=UPI001D567B1F|nr:calcium-translocating P-type ATPase, PMCA-type [Coprobacter fastidiosus]HJF43461.1 calcium-translocating P-type ATPase, PMCA-type [Coprobacter fastidiosus]